MIESDLPYSLSVDNLWELPSRQDDTEREGRRVTYRGGIQHLCQAIKVALIRCAESDAPPLWSSSAKPMNCWPRGSSVLQISQERILEWVAISYSRGTFWPRDQTCIFCIAGRFFTTWEAQVKIKGMEFNNWLFLIGMHQYRLIECKEWAIVIQDVNNSRIWM